MTLTRDQILAAPDLKTEIVAVPEWGGEVIVRMMTAAERDDFESKLFIGEGDKRRVNQANFRARLCSICLVDDSGDRLFKVEDVDALGRKSAAALERVFEAAQRLNGMGEKAVDAAKKD
jgi:hypothetical protein